MNGRTPKADSRPATQNLAEIEEDVIVQYILDLDSRGFPPSIEDVRAMADYILASRGARRVGKLWSTRFIKRREELRTRFSRAYDFQRALYGDPRLISEWFALFSNMRAKYGIQDCDLYNFDETGFMMGKAIQPGNREWATAITCVSGDGFNVPPFLLV